jgi:Restriction endonuclease fold toxin 9
LGTGYKWIGFENGLWMPVKRINLNGVRKAGIDGWDINWHVQDQKFNIKNFDIVLDSLEDQFHERKVLNARISKECGCCPRVVVNNNLFEQLIFGLKVHALPSCGSTNPNTASSAARGRTEHAKWANDPNTYYGPGYQPEQKISDKSRADAINYEQKKIKELKPDTPSGKYKGEKQIERYVTEMKNKTGDNGWTGEIVYYKKKKIKVNYVYDSKLSTFN